jgi:hypothetical protein
VLYFNHEDADRERDRDHCGREQDPMSGYDEKNFDVEASLPAGLTLPARRSMRAEHKIRKVRVRRFARIRKIRTRRPARES